MKIKEILISITYGILLLSLGLFGGIAGAGLQNEFNIYDKILYKTEVGIELLETTDVDDIIAECNKNISNSRIDNNLGCILSHVEKFYFYQRRADDENITFNKLMQEGGDCGNWARFWEYIGKENNYEINPIRVTVNESVSHRFSVISNKQGYCLIDQITMECTIYG